jgi:cytochrome c oxidase subunit 2
MSVMGGVATTQANTLLGDWEIFFWAGVGIYAIVVGLIVFCLLMWHRRENDRPSQFKTNTKLEITYTIIPLLIVAGLFYVTITREWSVEAIAAKPYATVQVTGYRWSWRFFYPNAGVVINGTPQAPPEMALPLGETTQVDLISTDVNHAFWVPAFLFKRDAIPGFTNSFDFTPTRAGVYIGRCAEFCGLDHAMMTFTVRVLPPAAFQAWLANHRRMAAS